MYRDQASGFVVAAEFIFMSCPDYKETYTNRKTLKGRIECVFRG